MRRLVAPLGVIALLVAGSGVAVAAPKAAVTLPSGVTATATTTNTYQSEPTGVVTVRVSTVGYTGATLHNVAVTVVDSTGNVTLGTATVASIAKNKRVDISVTDLPRGNHTARLTYQGLASPYELPVTIDIYVTTATLQAATPASSTTAANGVFHLIFATNVPEGDAIRYEVRESDSYGQMLRYGYLNVPAGQATDIAITGLTAGKYWIGFTGNHLLNTTEIQGTFGIPVVPTLPTAPIIVGVGATQSTSSAGNAIAEVEIKNPASAPATRFYVTSSMMVNGQKVALYSTYSDTIASGASGVTSLYTLPAGTITVEVSRADNLQVKTTTEITVERGPNPVPAPPTVSVHSITQTGSGATVTAYLCNTADDTRKAARYTLYLDNVSTGTTVVVRDGQCANGVVNNVAIGQHTLKIVGNDGTSAHTVFPR